MNKSALWHIHNRVPLYEGTGNGNVVTCLIDERHEMFRLERRKVMTDKFLNSSSSSSFLFSSSSFFFFFSLFLSWTTGKIYWRLPPLIFETFSPFHIRDVNWSFSSLLLTSLLSGVSMLQFKLSVLGTFFSSFLTDWCLWLQLQSTWWRFIIYPPWTRPPIPQLPTQHFLQDASGASQTQHGQAELISLFCSFQF